MVNQYLNNMPKKQFQNEVKTKAGIAITGAIGVDQVNPLGYVVDLEVNCSKGNYFKINLEGNIRLDLVNMLPGSFIFILKQDATGSRSITYSSKFKFVNAAGGDLSAAAEAIDLLNCIFDGENVYAVVLKNFT